MADRQKDEVPRDRSPGGGRGERDLSQWYQMTAVGMEFVVAVVLFGLLGWWLDGKLEMTPWLTLAGVGLGFGVGLWLMIRSAMRFFR